MAEYFSVEMIQASLKKRNKIKVDQHPDLHSHYNPGDYSDHIQGTV